MYPRACAVLILKHAFISNKDSNRVSLQCPPHYSLQISVGKTADKIVEKFGLLYEQFVENPAFKHSGVRRWRYMGPYNRIGEGELILSSGPVTKTVKHEASTSWVQLIHL